MSATAIYVWGGVMARERDDDGPIERRQLIDPKALVTILIGVVLSGISAFVAAYLGTQTKTAVLERAVAGVESNVSELKLLIGTLNTTVNNSNLAAARETSALQAAVAAQAKDLADVKDELKDADSNLSEEVRLLNLKIETFGRTIATVQGELNAERRTKKE